MAAAAKSRSLQVFGWVPVPSDLPVSASVLCFPARPHISAHCRQHLNERARQVSSWHAHVVRLHTADLPSRARWAVEQLAPGWWRRHSTAGSRASGVTGAQAAGCLPLWRRLSFPIKVGLCIFPNAQRTCTSSRFHGSNANGAAWNLFCRAVH